jgi:hypothetical protein
MGGSWSWERACDERREWLEPYFAKILPMSLSEYAVRSCPGQSAFISGPHDFVLDAGCTVDSSRMLEPDISPYCFDLANRTLLCVSTPDISDATFFYQAQRQHAHSVIKVPFDALSEGSDAPALIFSVGRCGSTLLVRALQAAGVRTVSEPDFFTQAACHQPPDVSLRRAIAGATRLLPYSVIKLRLECNNAPLLIAGAFDSPRIMFVLRDPVDWAASLRRLSRNSLDLGWAVGQLGRSLRALDELTRNYVVRICYYEDFRTLDSRYVADLVSWTGESGSVSAEALRSIAAKDAQEGSIVSRASVRDVPDDLPFRDEFRRAWSRLRPAELIDRLQLKLL